MHPDYSPKSYYRVTMNRKRQIIDAMLEDLHAQHEDMLEQALQYSDMQEARDVIAWIKGKL